MLKFAVLGLGHGHIFEVLDELSKVGFVCAGCNIDSSDEHVLAKFKVVHPDIGQFEKQRLLEDPAISLAYIAAHPKDRCRLALEALAHGKHVLLDKPAVNTLEEVDLLEEAIRKTGLTVTVCFNERLCVRSAVAASRLIEAGAIGKVVQTVGLGPHRLDRHRRSDWFFDPDGFGRILINIAAHQIDQFLHYTGSKTAEIVSSTVGNMNTPENPDFDDFGEMHLRTPHATGFMRVDWYTPAGLQTWGDGRMFILGTEGYIELRKFIDIAGRPNGEHLFLVDGKGTNYIDCANEPLSFFEDLKTDILDGTCTAFPPGHVLEVSRISIKAQAAARRIGPKDE